MMMMMMMMMMYRQYQLRKRPKYVADEVYYT